MLGNQEQPQIPESIVEDNGDEKFSNGDCGILGTTLTQPFAPEYLFGAPSCGLEFRIAHRFLLSEGEPQI